MILIHNCLCGLFSRMVCLVVSLRLGSGLSGALLLPIIIKSTLMAQNFLMYGQASFGFVIRDSKGKKLLCGACALDLSASILVAEVSGLREGIRWAISLGIRKIIVECDNMALIQSIKNIWKIP